MPDVEDKSIAFKLLGHRSLLSWIFGTFFSNASNTSGILAIVLVGTVIYLELKNGSIPDQLLGLVGIIVGFYFGGTRSARESQSSPRELP